MKKSTVLIVLITFLVSVVIVGIFGMRFRSYNTTIYIESIEPTRVITSTNTDGIIIKRTGGENEYNVIVLYEEGMTIQIEFEYTPTDATNGNVGITVLKNKDAVEVNNLTVKLLSNKGTQLDYRPLDGGTAKFTVYLFAVDAERYEQISKQYKTKGNT